MERDANRLIRWEGWRDVDAFSVSVLDQMQKQLGDKIAIGSFTLAEEPAIAKAVAVATLEAKSNPKIIEFVMNPNLEGNGEGFKAIPTLYVWTYRRNYADTGLYQLYVSVKGKMLIGEVTKYVEKDIPGPTVLHKDIQSLNYEFGDDYLGKGSKDGKIVTEPLYADIEIWRGAVVHVNPQGVLEVVGNEAGVVTNYGKDVEDLPISAWEKAPSLEGNPNYNPKCATGAAFVEPLERAISIRENSAQKQAGDVQKRVYTVTPF